MGVFDRKLDESTIDLGRSPGFWIGDLYVRPAERLLIGGDIKRELQPRVMQVLIALARASPDVVSRDELAQLCWGGRIVGDDSLNRCVLALRHVVTEFPVPPFAIQTIPRVGHRLVAQQAGAMRFAALRWSGPKAIGTTVALLAAAGIALWYSPTETPPVKVADTTAAGRGATDPHVYNLYQTASNLIRTRSRESGPIAVNLLNDAIKADPGYAPAWARLGEATLLAGALNDNESFIAAVAQAQSYVRHALRLDPRLAEAHRAMGAMIPFGSPAAVSHLRRAAQLDPNSPENLVGLGVADGATGDFERELADYRRAAEIKPDYFRAVAALALATAEMGDRARAELIARRGLGKRDIQRDLLLGKIAWTSGDFSEAVRHWSVVEAFQSPRWSEAARRFRDESEQFLNIGTGALVSIPRPLDQRHLGRVGLLEPPSPAAWALRNRNPVAAGVYRDQNHVAAKLMLNAGRWREVAEAFYSLGGAAGIRSSEPLRPDQLTEVPVVVIALRRAGRARDASRLLHDANLQLAAVYGKGQVPNWMDVNRAAIHSLQGRRDDALASLGRAIERGWRSGGSTDLDDINAEPAFASLRDDPRFQRLRARLAAHRARERAETLALAGT